MLLLAGCQENGGVTESGIKWKWEKGTIVLDSPQRPSGQESVLNLTTPALPVVRVAFVGLGARGPYAVERCSRY